jgi:hypothetical protein
MSLPDPTIDEIRDEVAFAVENTSLRSVARQLKMSPTGLKKFLEGTAPYAPTRRRLRIWHEEHGSTPSAVDPELFGTALGILFHDLPDTPEVAVLMDRAHACLEVAHGRVIPRVGRVPANRGTPPAVDCGCRSQPLVPPSTRPAPVTWNVARPAAPQFAGVS